MKRAVAGLPVHTRALSLVATHRDDGRWAVEGRVLDLRKQGWVPMPDGAHPAGIIHDMRLGLTIDPVPRRLEALDVAQHAVAMERSEATRGESCRDPVGRLQELVGVRFDAALPRELGRVFGGPRGCSHLLTLLFLAASALPRALDFEAARREAGAAPRRAGEKPFRRALYLDGSQPDEELVQLAVQLGDFHERPRADVRDRLDVLALQAEVRAVASVRLADVSIAELAVAERERTRETRDTAAWQDRTPLVADLVGRPIMPGLGTALRTALAAREEAERMLATLLQLAPGFVQCLPTLAEGLFASGASEAAASNGAPTRVFALGGGVDSCYMWRREGPLAQLRHFGGSDQAS